MIVVSDEAVEKAARALASMDLDQPVWDEIPHEEREGLLVDAEAVLVAALPVIERDLREQIGREIETLRNDNPWRRAEAIALDVAAARVREGGRA